MHRGGGTINAAPETCIGHSTPSGLTTVPARSIRASLIPEGRLSQAGTVSMFSTRSVCTTCRSASATVQKAASRTCGLVALELRPEDSNNTLERACICNVQSGSDMRTRGKAGGQGSVATFRSGGNGYSRCGTVQVREPVPAPCRTGDEAAS